MTESSRAGPSHTRSGRYIDLDEEKLRGGYYTPPDLVSWICSWAVRSKSDRVLEPSCGDGAFLVGAVDRLTELRASPELISKSLRGIEISGKEASRARRRLHKLLGPCANAVVNRGDFFSWTQKTGSPSFDAIVGNPPFIRYQTFPEPHRSRAMQIMLAHGLTPNRLTNIWVPFVVAGYGALRAGGRLAMVLPAELLQVTYAAQLRLFLADRFERIDVVACNELFFTNAEQEVLLVLADGALKKPSEGNACLVRMTETKTVKEIVDRKPEVVLANAVPKTIRHDREKWLKYFLSERQIALMRELRSSSTTTSLSSFASVDVGVVTGRNEFFVLNRKQMDQLQLGSYTLPLISRSVHLKGAQVSLADWRELDASGDRVHLLHLAPLNGATPKGPLARYIRKGEEAAVDRGYKCSIRTPWYAVPSVWIPQGFVFRQIYDFPRFVLNEAAATSTDTIHRLRCNGDAEIVIANMYTYLTAASAEIEGRSYGGGVLELEPNEAERLLVPAALSRAMPLDECDGLIRAGRIDRALEENSRLILIERMGLTRQECSLLQDVWTTMRERRHARSRKVESG